MTADGDVMIVIMITIMMITSLFGQLRLMAPSSDPQGVFIYSNSLSADQLMSCGRTYDPF
jgi:hypothetical protein